MKAFKVFKIFLFLCVFWRVAESNTEDKLHKADDSSIFLIDADYEYNWFEAWNECSVKNMTLVAIDTPEKQSALETILRKQFEQTNLWIGGNDLGETSKYIWSSTGKQFVFSNWGEEQPDNFEDAEHCAHIWYKSDFQWNDLPCSEKMGYICEENQLLLAKRRDWKLRNNIVMYFESFRAQID